MPYVQGDMKELNRRAVFDMIAEVGEVSRVDIGNTLGISSPTVLKITSFLMGRGIVTLAGEEKTARGRRPQLLRFDPDSLIGIGVDYDGSTVKAAVCNYWGQQKGYAEQPADDDFDMLMERVLPEMLDKLLKKSDVEQANVCGVGICIPGAVNTAEAGVKLGALSGIRMGCTPAESAKLLRTRMDMQVYLFNDVNAAATGEYVLRKLRGEDLVYISAGEGIGAGIILDGKLRTGKHFYTGEIAHIVFDPMFTTDISRPGWLEAQLSSVALQARFPAGQQNEQIDYVAQHLALAIANICNILDIETVILDGEWVKRMGSELMRLTAEYTARLCMFNVMLYTPSCKNPSLTGAASMALELELDNVLMTTTE